MYSSVKSIHPCDVVAEYIGIIQAELDTQQHRIRLMEVLDKQKYQFLEYDTITVGLLVKQASFMCVRWACLSVGLVV